MKNCEQINNSRIQSKDYFKRKNHRYIFMTLEIGLSQYEIENFIWLGLPLIIGSICNIILYLFL